MKSSMAHAFIVICVAAYFGAYAVFLLKRAGRTEGPRFGLMELLTFVTLVSIGLGLRVAVFSGR
jgi:hypothetical protein